MSDEHTPGPSRFFEVYETQSAPWDTGRPQPVYARLVSSGLPRGSVLDVGCGTGENALLFTEHGHEVWGVDLVPKAIELAQEKALRRGLNATFRVADALDLSGLGRGFDLVIDSGLFHVFSDADRPRFVRSLEAVLPAGGRYALLCFSDEETRPGGPRRVSQGELRATFAEGWHVESIEAARFESRLHEDGARAWFAQLVRR